MKSPFFITGIGTDIGKTLISAIVTEALAADYWKPVQAGYAEGTDAELVASLISNPLSKIHPELYKLQTPASPIPRPGGRVLLSIQTLLPGKRMRFSIKRGKGHW